jgi:hypothetical protein
MNIATAGLLVSETRHDAAYTSFDCLVQRCASMAMKLKAQIALPEEAACVTASVFAYQLLCYSAAVLHVKHRQSLCIH